MIPRALTIAVVLVLGTSGFAGSSYEGDAETEGDGEGGIQTLTFEALRSGTAVVKLIYGFSEGADRDPSQRETFEVEVGDGEA